MLEIIVPSASALLGVALGSLSTYLGTRAHTKTQKNLQLRDELRPIAAKVLQLAKQAQHAKVLYSQSRSKASMVNTGQNRRSAEVDLLHWQHLHEDLELTLEELSILTDLDPASSKLFAVTDLTLEQQEVAESTPPITEDRGTYLAARQQFLKELRALMKI